MLTGLMNAVQSLHFTPSPTCSRSTPPICVSNQTSQIRYGILTNYIQCDLYIHCLVSMKKPIKATVYRDERLQFATTNFSNSDYGGQRTTEKDKKDAFWGGATLSQSVCLIRTFGTITLIQIYA